MNEWHLDWARLGPELIPILPWVVTLGIFLSNWGGSNTAELRQPPWARLGQRVLLAASITLVRFHLPWPAALDVKIWPDAPWQADLGVAGAYVGCLLASWARLTIAGNYSTDIVTSQGHRLVTKGPYGLMRHPIYAGLLVAIASSALTPATPAKLIGLGFATIFVLWRAFTEDGLLERRFGAEFDAYRNRVRALVPHIL
jgi:protein-S-isoprenylcysteine O-methyltransferase Ste14